MTLSEQSNDDSSIDSKDEHHGGIQDPPHHLHLRSTNDAQERDTDRNLTNAQTRDTEHLADRVVHGLLLSFIGRQERIVSSNAAIDAYNLGDRG